VSKAFVAHASEATVRARARTRIGPFTVLTKRHPQKFANSDITQSLLTYLGRYREFTSPDEMKRVVSLLHRQAVRAKAEGLFFQVKSLCLTLVPLTQPICFGQVSALNLFKTVLGDQKSFPKDQPYKDLVALINYILRQFFKAVEADSFVLIEVTLSLPTALPSQRNRHPRVYRHYSRRTGTNGKSTRAGNLRQRVTTTARTSIRSSRPMSKLRKDTPGASSLPSPWLPSRRQGKAN
jgi:hypothetical protein